MDVQPDFKELFECFGRHKVEYVVVGAYALAFHGVPRNTGDIDVYIRPTPANADRVLRALKDFGFSSLKLERKDFDRPGQVIQLGHPPARVDLLTSITGVTWGKAAAGRKKGRYGKVKVPYLGLAQVRANKRATGRKKDLADLEALGEGKAKGKKSR